jgi:signal transduction histidine kinase
VVADPIQLEQVLAHLVTNARSSLRETGRIVLVASATRLDAEGARKVGLTADGPYAQVAVTAEGGEPRLDPLEPTAADAAIGDGAGLEVAIATGLVELHRGAVRVSGKPGRGATVTVLLPLVGAGRLPG